MSRKQLQGFRVVGLVESGRITLEEAAMKIGVSYRQARRICKRVREKESVNMGHPLYLQFLQRKGFVIVIQYAKTNTN